MSKVRMDIWVEPEEKEAIVILAKEENLTQGEIIRALIRDNLMEDED